MASNTSSNQNKIIILAGLGVALVIAVFLSPLASKNPDGLDRASEDLQFSHKATEDAPATRLPFYRLFDEYAVRHVPEQVATPIAGLVGTLATFGLAWGVGKLVSRGRSPSESEDLAVNQTNSSNEE